MHYSNPFKRGYQGMADSDLAGEPAEAAKRHPVLFELMATKLNPGEPSGCNAEH